MAKSIRAFVVLASVVIYLLAVGPPRQLASAHPADLQAAWGGACQDCMYDNTGPCVGTTCEPQGSGVWLKVVGTLVTPIWCFDVGPGEPGAHCEATLPMACKTQSTCTDAACNNCSNPASQLPPVKTKCTLSGTLCTGQGG